MDRAAAGTPLRATRYAEHHGGHGNARLRPQVLDLGPRHHRRQLVRDRRADPARRGRKRRRRGKSRLPTIGTALGRNPNDVELAWHIYLHGLDSGFNYYGGLGNDDEVKASLATTRAIQKLQPWMTSTRRANDRTPPTVLKPQRYPYNPGTWNFGWFNRNPPADNSYQKLMPSEFYVWTHAYDVSGITNIAAQGPPRQRRHQLAGHQPERNLRRRRRRRHLDHHPDDQARAAQHPASPQRRREQQPDQLLHHPARTRRLLFRQGHRHQPPRLPRQAGRLLHRGHRQPGQRPQVRHPARLRRGRWKPEPTRSTRSCHPFPRRADRLRPGDDHLRSNR